MEPGRCTFTTSLKRSRGLTDEDMLFNSLEFTLFAITFFFCWPLLKRRNASRWIYLTAASFFFYGWWDWHFLFLILASGFIDFFAALAMVRDPARRKLYLILSVLGNLGSLGLFKYLDFAIGNANWMLGAFGVESSIPLASLTLPVGISFYTFQSMSYTIDVYRNKLTPTSNVFHFFAYLSMFPQLVAGPIVRAAELLPQLETPRPTTEQQRWDGSILIVYGFFKKMVVADAVAPVVNAAFAMEDPALSAIYWWVVIFLFAFQIYCDFSGYSDIARGLAKWMGYEFPLNFDHPYISTSIREFWTRWHISLSSWFRDYVYIPIGGSRGNTFFGIRNMCLVMLISGLWHGAAWTFVIWGALHAFYLTIERLTGWPEKIRVIPGGKHLSVLIVFVLALIAWVFFRAESLPQALTIVQRMFDWSHPGVDLAKEEIALRALAPAVLLALRQVYVYLSLDSAQWSTPWMERVMRPVSLGALLAICVFFRGPGAAFIYFEF